VLFTYFSAEETALSHELVDFRTQVSMIEEKPASLPPIVMLTRVVDALSDESWLLMTSLVLAPEHAANVNDAGELAFPHRGAYALGLWTQDPLVLPAPTPEE
jgi:hypothetical protein